MDAAHPAPPGGADVTRLALGTFHSHLDPSEVSVGLPPQPCQHMGPHSLLTIHPGCPSTFTGCCLHYFLLLKHCELIQGADFSPGSGVWEVRGQAAALGRGDPEL